MFMKMIAIVAAVLSFSASGAMAKNVSICNSSFWKMAVVDDLRGLRNPNQMCLEQNVRVIHLVAGYASLEVWEYFLNMGLVYSGKDATGDRAEPIHWAASDIYYGADKVRILLEKGVSVDVKDAHGNSPLIWGIYNNNIPVVETLLENGGRLDVKNRSRGKFPCEYAKSDEMKKWLLDYILANHKSDDSPINSLAARCRRSGS